MNTLSMTFIVLISALTLSACQTGSVDANKSKTISQSSNSHENILVPLPDIPDSDGDGVLDDIDNCPQTPKNIVVDIKGCPIIIEGGEALEIEFNGYFAPMSHQFFDRYEQELAKIEEKLSENPDAKVFIFGHATANELAMLPSNEQSSANNLSRHRATTVKKKLTTEHNITPNRITTYDCLDRYPSNKLHSAHNGLKDVEAKGRRVTLKASTQVNDLANIKNASDLALYEDYINYCQPF